VSEYREKDIPPSDTAGIDRGHSEDAARRVSRLEAANRELDAFARAVSLELQAPMRTVLQCAEDLFGGYSDQLDDRGRQDLEQISASVRRMEQLVTGLVALASVSANEVHAVEVDLTALAREIAAQLSAQTPAGSVEIVVQDALTVRGDRYWLWTLLKILLDNAWKAVGSRPHGRVEVGTTPAGQPPVYFVRDNGVGFDMRYADQLFRPFQYLGPGTDPFGAGIGLALAKRIVRRHGGFIWAEGTVGRGAAFYFTVA
jgi:light-regulated signal transduction histidine kinase (bacteriophytochrome)